MMEDKQIIFDLQNVGLKYRRLGTFPWQGRDFWALHDVSFRVSRGETVGIIGRNGAGKSSLLRILANIVKPDKGTIIRAPVEASILSGGIGFDPRLTGRQNIMFSSLLLGMDKRHARGVMDQVIELAGIDEAIDEPVKTYSSGMRSRLGFAIVYYVETEIMLLDEILASGDHTFKEMATKLMKQKIQSDRTVVIVSHAMPTVRELCDRVIRIEDGHSMPEKPPKETIQDYLDAGGRKRGKGRRRI